MSDKYKKHISLPLDTPAFLCAGCGAVALNPCSVCKVQGKVTRSDWCGTNSPTKISGCLNHLHHIRYYCLKCNRVAINPELLCNPEKM